MMLLRLCRFQTCSSWENHLCILKAMRKTIRSRSLIKFNQVYVHACSSFYLAKHDTAVISSELLDSTKDHIWQATAQMLSIDRIALFSAISTWGIRESKLAWIEALRHKHTLAWGNRAVPTLLICQTIATPFCLKPQKHHLLQEAGYRLLVVFFTGLRNDLAIVKVSKYS